MSNMKEWTENLKDLHDYIYYSKDLDQLTSRLRNKKNVALYRPQNGGVVELSHILRPLENINNEIDKESHQDVNLKDTSLWQKQYKNRFTRGSNLSLDINLRKTIGDLKVEDTLDDDAWIITSHNKF